MEKKGKGKGNTLSKLSLIVTINSWYESALPSFWYDHDVFDKQFKSLEPMLNLYFSIGLS